MSLYLLNISLPFQLALVAVFGVVFLYAGSLWFLFIVEVPPCDGGLDVWLIKVSWLGKLVSVFWWVQLDLFFWSAEKCPVVSFEVFMGLV